MKFLNKPHLIMVDGWRKISFFLDGKYRHIPTDRMIEDLLYPPITSRGWDTLPPDIFDSIPKDERQKVNKLIDRITEIFDSPDASWELIRKFLFKKEDKKVLIAGVLSPLYKEVALRAYRIDYQSVNPDSVVALKELSNVVVQELTTVVAELNSHEKILFDTHFTEEHYKWFLYLTLVECYCFRVLPCPKNKVLNRQKSYDLFSELQNIPSPSMANSDSVAGNIQETRAACYSRFADWRMTRKIAIGLNDEILPNSAFLEAFKKVQNDKLYQSIGANIKAQRGDRSGEYTKLLYQCEFCYVFRLEERKGNGSRDRFCDECKQSKKLKALNGHLERVQMSGGSVVE
jgi:hypothetical protein